MSITFNIKPRQQDKTVKWMKDKADKAAIGQTEKGENKIVKTRRIKHIMKYVI